MKTITAILLLTGLIMVTSTASAADVPPASSNSLELVLDCDFVSVSTATNISMRVTYRNVGETTMYIGEMLVVWDGKEYEGNGKRDVEVGPAFTVFSPMAAKRRIYPFSYFLIPASAQTPGKHTLAVKVGSAESNTLTVFIRPQK